MASPLTAKQVARWGWQLLAVMLVLFALGVSLIRGLLPKVDDIRLQLIDYVKTEYQLDANVGELSAQWQAFGPAVTLDNLVLPPQEKLPFTVLVKQVQIKLDFWQSLLAASPRIEDVNFDGVKLELDMAKLQAPIQTTAQAASKPSSPQLDWLYKLLLKQLERFSLTNASVQLSGGLQDFHPIYIKQLHWRNTTDNHRGAGDIYLDDDASEHESLSLQIDIHGDGAAPDSLTGQIYLAAKALDLGEWTSRQSHPYEANQILPLEGVVNLQAWFELADRRLHSGLVQFQPSWLQWSMDGAPQKLEIRSGNIGWMPTKNGWEISSSGFELATNGEPWPEFTLAAKQENDALFGYLSQLDIASMFPLLPLLPGLDAAVLEQWYQLAPEGKIGPVRLYQNAQQPLLASAEIKQLHWQKRSGIPNSHPLDIALLWQGDKLAFSLPEQDYSIDFGDEFSAPLVFSGSALTGDFNPQTLSVTVPRLRLENDDLSLQAGLKLDFSAKASMSLAAQVEVKNAANADKYFPIQAMGEPLVEYLDGAIKAGQSQNAKVLWQGAFADFPFDDQSGVFQASFTLDNAEYQFQPDWPAITDLSLDALFENARMDIWVNKGKLMDVAADGAHVFIPELSEHSLLKIQAELATQGRAATKVLQASPLADTVGATLSVIQVQGAVTGNLDLSIPLYGGEDEDIRGQISFENTPVWIDKPGLQLNGVTGTVQFANEIVTGKGIKSRLFEQPLELSFATKPEGKDFGLKVGMKSRWDLNRLPSQLNNPLRGVYQGKLAWNGDIKLLFNEQGYQIQASANSDLVGTTLTLPPPFAKPADEPRPLSAELVGDAQGTRLTLRLAQQAEFIGGFGADDAARLNYYDLLLGRLFNADETPNAQLGHIGIDMASTKLAGWLPIINAFVGNKSPREGILRHESAPLSPFPPLASIDATIGKFDLLSQGLTELKLAAKANENGWRFDAKANEFEGAVNFYSDWKTQGLQVTASKLYFSPHIKPDAEADYGSAQVLTNLPPLTVDVADFRFFDKPFGKLVLQASPQSAGYRIHTLSLSTPDVSLQGKGIWQQQNGQNQTEMSVSLSATQFEHLSEQLGIDPGVNEAPFKASAELAWKGAPYAFSLETLNGKVKFELGKGHLSQVSDKGARIFSLFSLDSLVRKLSLDFSDVFGKGMYFNTFSGNLQIDNGVVKTTDTEMDAIAGNIKVRGDADLTTESLNYDIRFVPQLASSVPTVVLLSTSAWTLGVGAFALTKVLEPVIEVISEIRFRVTGTMSDPLVDELERKSKEIEIPKSILPMVSSVDSSAQPKVSTSDLGAPKTDTLDTGIPNTSALNTETLNAAPKLETQEPQLERPLEFESPAKLQSPAKLETPIVPANDDSINPSQGESNEHQPTAMSEQSRRQRESAVYRIAA